MSYRRPSADFAFMEPADVLKELDADFPNGHNEEWLARVKKEINRPIPTFKAKVDAIPQPILSGLPCPVNCTRIKSKLPRRHGNNSSFPILKAVESDKIIKSIKSEEITFLGFKLPFMKWEASPKSTMNDAIPSLKTPRSVSPSSTLATKRCNSPSPVGPPKPRMTVISSYQNTTAYEQIHSPIHKSSSPTTTGPKKMTVQCPSSPKFSNIKSIPTPTTPTTKARTPIGPPKSRMTVISSYQTKNIYDPPLPCIEQQPIFSPRCRAQQRKVFPPTRELMMKPCVY